MRVNLLQTQKTIDYIKEHNIQDSSSQIDSIRNKINHEHLIKINQFRALFYTLGYVDSVFSEFTYKLVEVFQSANTHVMSRKELSKRLRALNMTRLTVNTFLKQLSDLKLVEDINTKMYLNSFLTDLNELTATFEAETLILNNGSLKIKKRITINDYVDFLIHFDRQRKTKDDVCMSILKLVEPNGFLGKSVSLYELSESIQKSKRFIDQKIRQNSYSQLLIQQEKNLMFKLNNNLLSFDEIQKETIESKHFKITTNAIGESSIEQIET